MVIKSEGFMNYQPDQIVTVSILEDILERKLDQKLNEKFAEFALKLIEFFEPRFRAIEERLDRLEAIVADHSRMFEELFAKFETLEQEYIFTNHQFKRMEERLQQAGAQSQNFQKEIYDLKIKTDQLQLQIDKLEKQVNSS